MTIGPETTKRMVKMSTEETGSKANRAGMAGRQERRHFERELEREFEREVET